MLQSKRISADFTSTFLIRLYLMVTKIHLPRKIKNSLRVTLAPKRKKNRRTERGKRELKTRVLEDGVLRAEGEVGREKEDAALNQREEAVERETVGGDLIGREEEGERTEDENERREGEGERREREGIPVGMTGADMPEMNHTERDGQATEREGTAMEGERELQNHLRELTVPQTIKHQRLQQMQVMREGTRTMKHCNLSQRR